MPKKKDRIACPHPEKVVLLLRITVSASYELHVQRGQWPPCLSGTIYEATADSLAHIL